MKIRRQKEWLLHQTFSRAMTIDKKECLIWPIVWPKLGSVRKNFPNTVRCFSHKLVFDLVPRKELKKDLPSQFVKAFLKRHGFHSWTYFVNFGSGDATSCFCLPGTIQHDVTSPPPARKLWWSIWHGNNLCPFINSFSSVAMYCFLAFWPLLVGADVGIEGTIVQHSCFCCHGKWQSGRIRTFEMWHKFWPKCWKSVSLGAKEMRSRGQIWL